MPPSNTLYYGDNLDILREYVRDASIDLIYLDPPFNSQRNYNLLFRDEKGKLSDAQITAFQDTWLWSTDAERTYRDLVTCAPSRVGAMVESMRKMLGTSPMMAYLVMMGARLVELYRVLKPTGSLYLHCDPTASHYLKVLLDTIFGPERFINEITWKRTSTHSDAKRWSPVADTLLFYAKSDQMTWNPQYAPHDPAYLASKYRYDDDDGRGPYRLDNMTSPNPRPNMMYEWRGHASPSMGWRYSRETMQQLHDEGRIWYPDCTSKRPQFKRYLNENPGRVMDSIWDDVAPLNSQAAERLGYPTQKPLALLERIIAASSNPGDMVLDPFCGCGTAIAAAERLGRPWAGIDITHLAIAIQKNRLDAMFPGVRYETIGDPKDLGAARALAQDPYQFQWWALSLIHARPLNDDGSGKRGKKGADRGIDGLITFFDEACETPKQALVQVKSGHVSSRDIRDLRGTIERERAAIGAFITLEEPSREMKREAVAAGFYHSPGWNRDYPKLQLLTIAQLLHDNAELQLPPIVGPFKQAQRSAHGVEQTGLWSD